ncbi:hypothetical protein [Actinoallomurus sp. CA-150999]|uniref:hypothetical protein n=1 Tax=Actinoallomurus sp. CA-150999 TaxID=3239887 RepID=UPI003D93FE3B
MRLPPICFQAPPGPAGLSGREALGGGEQIFERGALFGVERGGEVVVEGPRRLGALGEQGASAPAAAVAGCRDPGGVIVRPQRGLVPVLAVAGPAQVADAAIGISLRDPGMIAGGTVLAAIHLVSAARLTRARA